MQLFKQACSSERNLARFSHTHSVHRSSTRTKCVYVICWRFSQTFPNIFQSMVVLFPMGLDHENRRPEQKATKLSYSFVSCRKTKTQIIKPYPKHQQMQRMKTDFSPPLCKIKEGLCGRWLKERQRRQRRQKVLERQRWQRSRFSRQCRQQELRVRARGVCGEGSGGIGYKVGSVGSRGGSGGSGG